VAFAVPALEHSPDAEMAVVGSPFVERLLAAVRTRGGRYVHGPVPTSIAPEAAASLGVSVRSGRAGRPALAMARHPVGQLLARVVIRAGATVEEHLVDGGVFDLATGAPLPRYAAEHALVVLRSAQRARPAKAVAGVRAVSPRPMADLMDVMMADLRARLASRVEELRRDAERALATELIRIDGYYRSMIEDAGGRGTEEAAAEATRAIEVEHARRRLEEERRHQVRAAVHPLQMIEMEMIIQRAEWPLSTEDGRQATVAARRFLHGAAHWSLVCPTCARPPAELVVLPDGQVACGECRPEVEESVTLPMAIP
jgi:hypothetical protein